VVVVVHAEEDSNLGTSVVPVFKSMPQFARLLRDENLRGDLLQKVFAKLYDITDTSILHQDRFFFISTELVFHFNLFDDCGLQAWASHSVFVITSRLGFLSDVSCAAYRLQLTAAPQADNCNYIAPHMYSNEASLERVHQVFVAPFSQEQATEYIQNFAASTALNPDGLSRHWFQGALDANGDLVGMASSPLMLFIVLNILPSISGEVCSPPCFAAIRCRVIARAAAHSSAWIRASCRCVLSMS
jgi:hypothetical protein